MRRDRDLPALSDRLSELELLVGAREMDRRDFLVQPSGVHAIVDSVIVGCLTNFVEAKDGAGAGGPEMKHNAHGKEVQRPDVFVRGLARTGSIGISYLTLYESLDPKKSKKGLSSPAERESKYAASQLSAKDKQTMLERVQRLKEYNIRVVDVSGRAFRTALDLWFDTRQGLFGTKADPYLFDPIIAATAMVTGAQLYSANADDFTPYTDQYELNFTEVVQFGHYLGLAEAA